MGKALSAPGPKVLVSLFAFNEGDRLTATLARFPASRAYDVLIVDDGSTDGSTSGLSTAQVHLLQNARNEGLGASIKRAFRYALENGYDVLVIMAGNGKDNPLEIDRLLRPITHEGYDFVQGSRFLKGGEFGNMPLYRLIATKVVHPMLFSLLSGRKVTESSNGFRAFRTSILKDPEIRWDQGWLNQYELEQYVHYKVVRRGYKRIEVPVSKIYPTRRGNYTKVKPFSGWWSMVKPLFYLAAGIRR